MPQEGQRQVTHEPNIRENQQCLWETQCLSRPSNLYCDYSKGESMSNLANTDGNIMICKA
jgi:hypothetical protein